VSRCLATTSNSLPSAVTIALRAVGSSNPYWWTGFATNFSNRRHLPALRILVCKDKHLGVVHSHRTDTRTLRLAIPTTASLASVLTASISASSNVLIDATCD
jgi:hypothetical protein